MCVCNCRENGHVFVARLSWGAHQLWKPRRVRPESPDPPAHNFCQWVPLNHLLKLVRHLMWKPTCTEGISENVTTEQETRSFYPPWQPLGQMRSHTWDSTVSSFNLEKQWAVFQPKTKQTLTVRQTSFSKLCTRCPGLSWETALLWQIHHILCHCKYSPFSVQKIFLALFLPRSGSNNNFKSSFFLSLMTECPEQSSLERLVCLYKPNNWALPLLNLLLIQ